MHKRLQVSSSVSSLSILSYYLHVDMALPHCSGNGVACCGNPVAKIGKKNDTAKFFAIFLPAVRRSAEFPVIQLDLPFGWISCIPFGWIFPFGWICNPAASNPFGWICNPAASNIRISNPNPALCRLAGQFQASRSAGFAIQPHRILGFPILIQLYAVRLDFKLI